MKSLRTFLLVCPLLPLAAPAVAEVVVVVSAKSAHASLNKGQVADIFLGKTGTFPDGAQAIPVDHADGSPQREEFHGKVTGKSGAQLKSYWSKLVFSGAASPPKEVPGGNEAKSLIAANPNAIGYLDKGAVDGTVKVVLTP